MISKPTKHGGKRKGAGRKPAPDPVFTKKFRASESERIEFLALLTGNARKDFEIVFQAVRASSLANNASTRTSGDAPASEKVDPL